MAIIVYPPRPDGFGSLALGDFGVALVTPPDKTYSADDTLPDLLITNNLAVASGVTLTADPAGSIIVCRGRFTNGGTITASGLGGGTGTSGSPLPTSLTAARGGVSGSGTAGGAGATAIGRIELGPLLSAVFNATSSNPVGGGGGGTGQAGSSNSIGSDGTGGGGAGGAETGDAPATSGAGGVGGGAVLVYATEFDNSAGTIVSSGTDGEDGPNTNTHAGGGGGGGLVLALYGTLIAEGTLTAAGGSGGAGQGAGNDGGAGGSGIALVRSIFLG